MTVLAITGARGVVGSVLTPQLEAMGHDVIPLDLPDCDVLNANQLWHGLMRAEAVLHLAGEVRLVASWDTSESDVDQFIALL